MLIQEKNDLENFEVFWGILGGNSAPLNTNSSTVMEAKAFRGALLEVLEEKMENIRTKVTQLEDFEWVETNEENILIPTFTLAWCFDQQCKVHLKLSLQDGSAQLRQTYKGLSKLPENMMSRPLQFRNHSFETEHPKFWRCQLTSEWVNQIAKAFYLPDPYQEWKNTVATLKKLLKRIPGLNGSEYTYTTYEIRKLYKLFSLTAWIIFLQQVGKLQGLAVLGHRFLKSGQESLNPLVMQTKNEANQLYLIFIWEGCPKSIENVVVKVDDGPQYKVSFEWKADSLCLKLSNFNMSEKTSVGALWDKENGKLDLSFQTKSKN